ISTIGGLRVRRRLVFQGRCVIGKSCSTAIVAGLMLAPVTAHADFWSWLFGPKDYEDCAENATREAKSKDDLSILLFSCNSKFSGRRKPTGGYTFYESQDQIRHRTKASTSKANIRSTLRRKPNVKGSGNKNCKKSVQKQRDD